MMMKIKIIITVLSLTFLTACDYVQRREFRAERSEALYQSAMADYTAGRLDAAIVGFKKVLQNNPGNTSARFQLGCLLQDKKQDYLGALCCYREYLLLAEGGDKVNMAKDRSQICEKLLITEIAKKMNLADSSSLAKELDRINAVEKDSKDAVEKMTAKAQELEAKNKSLTEENSRLRRMLTSLGEETDDKIKSGNLADAKKIAADADGDRLKLSPDARKLFEEEEQADKARDIATSAREVAKDVKEDDDKVSSLLTRDEKTAEYKGPKLNEMKGDAIKKKAHKKIEPSHEERPEFYVVQDGDTLYKIALRFYGRRDAWRKIMDANKTEISSDARIITGQKLRLP